MNGGHKQFTSIENVEPYKKNIFKKFMMKTQLTKNNHLIGASSD